MDVEIIEDLTLGPSPALLKYFLGFRLLYIDLIVRRGGTSTPFS